MDEFLKTIIPTVESSGTEINILRTESNESSLLSSEENTEIEEISRETKENQTYLSIKVIFEYRESLEGAISRSPQSLQYNF